MPWCDDCARWYSPNALTPDGGCPRCGRPVATEEGSDDGHESSPSPPWHFWLVVAAVAVYLGWRLIQGIAWLIGRM